METTVVSQFVRDLNKVRGRGRGSLNLIHKPAQLSGWHAKYIGRESSKLAYYARQVRTFAPEDRPLATTAVIATRQTLAQAFAARAAKVTAKANA